MARVFWASILKHTTQSSHPKLYTLLSRLTSQSSLIGVSQSDTISVGSESVQSWYQMVKARLASKNMNNCLPDTLDDFYKILRISDYVEVMERTVSSELAYDKLIGVALRGLYDTDNRYISMSIITPLSREYIEHISNYVDSTYDNYIKCYFHYDHYIIKNYISNGGLVTLPYRQYYIELPSSMTYSSIVNHTHKSKIKISFTTNVASTLFSKYKSEPTSYIDDIDIICIYGDDSSLLNDNLEHTNYVISIFTKSPEKVLNYLKLKDILPYNVQISSLDPTDDQYFKFISTLHTKH